MIMVVTAFVPIPGHPRSEDEYVRLAEPLHELAQEIPLIAATKNLDQCWLAHYLHEFYPRHPTHSVGDNPAKNSLSYHVVQAEKTAFVVDAVAIAPKQCDVFVWLDYGLFHIPGMTLQIVREFLMRAQDEQAIAIPGCHEKGDFTYDDRYPNWRFAGGILVVPKQYVLALDVAMKREYVHCLEVTNNVSWEVNHLARVEHLHPELPIWWYGPCDHNSTMLTKYQGAGHADNKKTSVSKVSSGVLRL